jgi:hypothetical protein
VSQQNAFVARGIEIAKRGRPRKIHIEGEFDWLLRPTLPRKRYGKSESEPGRICSTKFCHEFVSGPTSRACPHCGAKK